MIEITKGHYIFGTVSVGSRGQIVIPKDARDKFGIKPGDSLLVIGEEKKGLAIIREDQTKDYLRVLIDDGPAMGNLPPDEKRRESRRRTRADD